MATTAPRDFYPAQPSEAAERSWLARPLALNWQVALYIAIFALAVFTRFYDLGARAMSHDESLHVYYSYELYTRGDFKHTPLMHGPILFHANAFFYSLFGDNDFTGRIYTSLLGVLMVMSPLLFRRWLGRWGTILACAMILISPLLMYYNRYIREDTPNIMATILMVWAILMYLNGPENQRRRAHWLYVIAATMLWSLGSKETAFMYIAVFGLFLTFYWIARMLQRAYNRPARTLFSGFIVGVLVAGVAALGMYIVLDITPVEEVARVYGMTWFTDLAADSGLASTAVWMFAIFVIVSIFTAVIVLLVLAVYFAARAVQRGLGAREGLVLPLFIGGVLLVMAGYIALDQAAYAGMQALRAPDIPLTEWDNAVKARSFVSWSLLVTLVTGVIVMGTMLWGLTGRLARVPWRALALLVVLAVVALTGLIIIEELSHVPSAETRTAVPAVPGEGEAVAPTGSFSWGPIILSWVFGIGGIVFLLYTRRAGWWKWLHSFPELDILMVMGSLILPWCTAIFIYLARGTPEEFIAIAAGVPPFISNILPVGTPEMTGKVLVGFLAWLPLMAGAIVAGLTWNWKRWLVASLVFHVLFAFFFTTVFTNIQGLATGMVYSLQYWLEQQGERRGSQPQYFYLLIIMPIYEYLPIIGSVLAMLAGLTTFWRRRVAFADAQAEARAEAVSVRYASATHPSDSPLFLEADGGAAVQARRERDPNPFTSLMVDPSTVEGYVPPARERDDGEIVSDAAEVRAAVAYAEAVEADLAPGEPIHSAEVVAAQAQDGDVAEARPDASADAAAAARRVTRLRARTLRLGTLAEVPFLLLWSWWAVFMLILLTLAGEKMPWLGTHMTLPMIFITAWYFGSVFDRIDFGLFRRRGWLILLLTPLLIFGLFQVVAGPLGSTPPFRGINTDQLSWTYGWLLALAVVVGVVVALARLAQITGARHLWQMMAAALFTTLALLTFRAAWVASFINYDYATEFLVYAHATPGTKIVIDKMTELSQKTTDGMDIAFAYDNKLSWPGVWYFRNFNNAKFMGETPTLRDMENAAVILIGAVNRSTVEPLLEDRYQRFEYTRMWWPMQDYFNLTAARIVNTFALNSNEPDPVVAADQMNRSALVRRGLFDIWWMRDYTTYSQGVGSNITTTTWPVAEDMIMYVRKDIAAQVWQYGAGDGTAINPIAQEEVSACVANWQEIPAVLEFQTVEAGLRAPIGIKVGPAGEVYVAEDANHRVSIFNPDGSYARSVGQVGEANAVGPFFQRPNSLAVAPDGTIYVVDTWNYRIRKFNPDWEQVAAWGTPLTAGSAAEAVPVDGFWGPRDAALDAQGNVYVSDTGNKRVRVYDPNGVWLRDIGRGGSGLGQLDEPSGLAISPDGRLFVADTWNRRISVFALDGTPLTTFPIRGWYDELGNRPYLAVDPTRNLLYVTDPDAGRVLVLDTDGTCVGAFGGLNREAPNSAQFATIGGIAVDGEGFVHVVDLANGRLLKFAPFEVEDAGITLDSAPSELGADLGDDTSGSVEIPADLPAEATVELSE